MCTIPVLDLTPDRDRIRPNGEVSLQTPTLDAQLHDVD